MLKGIENAKIGDKVAVYKPFSGKDPQVGWTITNVTPTKRITVEAARGGAEITFNSSGEVIGDVGRGNLLRLDVEIVRACLAFKRRVTARKWRGDDCYSWAVFFDGQVCYSGLGLSEVDYYKRQVIKLK